MAKEYWWISVGGESCEPAVVTDNGEVFTLGCPDPHDPATIEMVQKMGWIPDTPAEAERKRKAWEAKVERDRKRGIYHGYRRF